MFALVLLGLVASASTAAWYDSDAHELRMDRFWDNFERKMNNLNSEVENVVQNAKNQEWSRIEGNEYKINIKMSGFNKEDIVVKVRKGNIVIQANHNVPGEPTNNFLYVKDLPDFINENGSWAYNNGVLTIFFPIIQRESNYPAESNLGHNVNSVNEQPNGNYNQAVINGGRNKW